MEMGLLGGMQEDKSREVVGMQWLTTQEKWADVILKNMEK